MRASRDRIVTTHAGSLPRPPGLYGMLIDKDAGRPYDQAAFASQVGGSVADVVRRQIAIGIDVVDDGEYSKSSFASYGRVRLSGFEPTDKSVGFRGETRDSLAFPDTYDEMKRMFPARHAAGAPKPRGSIPVMACTGPVRYVGQAQVAADISNLKAALAGTPEREGFVTAISPTNLAMYHRNEFYPSDEAYMFALAEAMREEYRAITDADFLLQIDDPRVATHYNRNPGADLAECRNFIALAVEVINHALVGIPEEQVRFHTCYSVNVAPRVHDLELRHFVNLMLKIRAQGFSIEAANPRHEHEWRIWEETRLPEGKLLIPGMVSHCVYQVEHPELVAQRIERFAKVVGRENVIAANDCGFATSAAGDEVNAEVAWAKLEALTEGARLASQRLWS